MVFNVLDITALLVLLFLLGSTLSFLGSTLSFGKWLFAVVVVELTDCVEFVWAWSGDVLLVGIVVLSSGLGLDKISPDKSLELRMLSWAAAPAS
ncbi:hypothetical protein [Endozoicomonas sp. ONNA2]|uniref:hypothetical protein n=1 Tax=Endozoicomonas sp. ONNA2 TaxID=2828741 RepID=UPI00214773E7|nr:hypothetical protein [Endozoicomonas sp. ONNA2]